MKVMVMVKASADSEAGVLPGPQLLAKMGKFNDDFAPSDPTGEHRAREQRLRAESEATA